MLEGGFCGIGGTYQTSEARRQRGGRKGVPGMGFPMASLSTRFSKMLRLGKADSAEPGRL